MKRRLLLILLLLAGGAIVNVAVAWGCAILHRGTTYGTGVGRVPVQGMFAWDTADANWFITYMPEHGGALLSAHDTARAGGARLTGTIPKSGLPAWSQFKLSANDVTTHLPCWTEMARGWPCYALSNRVEEDLQAMQLADQRRVYSAIRVPYGPPECRLARGRESFLPLDPIWPGFAINTFFYAAILSMPFVGFALRRRRRIKRGLCLKCGYNLRNRPSDSSACPECGSRVG